MSTKTELESRIVELEQQLEAKCSRSTGHHIEHCSIDMCKPDETKIAVARAVHAGMIALQELGGNSYGLYLAAPTQEED